MIISKQKQFKDILKHLADEKKVFLVGCGECSTTCQSGGEPEVLKMKEALEKEGKVVTGWVVPKAPCVAPQIKISLAKNKKALVAVVDSTSGISSTIASAKMVGDMFRVLIS